MIKFFKKNKFIPQRLKADESSKDFTAEEVKLINLLNYTKKSGSTYSGEIYNAGYHTIKIGEKTLVGQRNPAQRLENIPYDFTNKSVLDIGCNQGGMLREIADKIKFGVGLDYDSRMINVANRIKSFERKNNLSFYVFDLEKENLAYINDFLPTEKLDVCFLLSVCMWLKNWKELLWFVKQNSTILIFESNGNEKQQNEQISFLKTLYKEVNLINETSEDDPLQKKRMLFLCKN